MAEVHQFSFGFVTPVLAYLMSALGCLLGFLIAKKARRHHGGRRVRLLIYATIAFGGIGVWLGHAIALLGSSVGGSVMRYDPVPLAASLAVGLLDVGTALFLAGYGRPRWWRLLTAGLLTALGATATEYVAMDSLRGTAMMAYNRTNLLITAAIAVAVGGATLWCIASMRRLRFTVFAAVFMAAALSAMHYIGAFAMHIDMSGPGASNTVGLTPLVLLAPIVLGGAATMVLLAFFTIGNASRHELLAIYDVNADELDPALVEEVTARIALGMGGPSFGERGLDADAPLRVHQIPLEDSTPVIAPLRPRPTPGTIPTWRSMPVWGQAEPGTDLVVVERAANARSWRRRARDLPAMPVGALPPDRDRAALAAGPVVPATSTVYASAASAELAVGAPLTALADGIPSRYPPGFNPRAGAPEPDQQPELPRRPRPRNQREP